MKLYGPFKELITMHALPLHGSLSDNELPVTQNGGIVTEDGYIKAVGLYEELEKEFPSASKLLDNAPDMVAIPGLIDCHTHICWAGHRANDYAQRMAGKSYLSIAKDGGGIMSTVKATRASSQEELEMLILDRADHLLKQGITIAEVKSGYGLNKDDELKILRAIKYADIKTPLELIPTFLGAHIKPVDFSGDHKEYLRMIIEEIIPVIIEEDLCNRADIFVEEGAFDPDLARKYATDLKELDFDMTMHVDQFNSGGSGVAVESECVSADHLECIDDEGIKAFQNSSTVAVALPGASMGLGMQFTPCRKLLDNDACLAIASDWNPGSAPMGDLLTQASVIGAAEKLTLSETLAGITYRAAQALRMDAGVIHVGAKARVTIFETSEYQQIFYRQGQLKPKFTIIENDCYTHQ